MEVSPLPILATSGVSSVMTGHIAVPALDGRRDRPATFSPEILQDVLRGELGFEGLIVSDAMDMAGALIDRWDGAAAVAAVQAGVDVLMVPNDAQVSWRAVVDAVRRGDIDIARIDASVARILETKRRLQRQASGRRVCRGAARLRRVR